MKKTIAFVCTDFLLGGSEQVCYNTAKYLAQCWGIKSYFLGTRSSEHAQSRITEAGGEYIELPENNGKRLFLTPSNLSYLVTKIESLDIDLVFFMAGAEQVLTAEVRRQLPCQVALWHHLVPLKELQEKLLRTQAKAKRSWLSWLEYQLITRPKYEYSTKRYRKLQEAYKQQIALSDYYLVLCPEYAEHLIADLQLPPEQAKKIRPMINTQPEATVPHLSKEREIIYMGRLDRGQKRVDRLLRIWQRVQAQLPDWRLRIYGSGGDEGYLKSLAQALLLKRCSFEGRIQYPAEAYRTASVLCMTSNYEGFPLAMVEAQCHGVIPMAFDVCTGIRYVAGKGKCKAGILVPAFDLDAYAEGLVSLCLNEETRKQLQQACLDKAKDYAPTVNDPQWLDILA